MKILPFRRSDLRRAATINRAVAEQRASRLFGAVEVSWVVPLQVEGANSHLSPLAVYEALRLIKDVN